MNLVEEKIQQAKEEGQPLSSQQSLRRILVNLSDNARPLNYQWRKLEHVWGFDGDRIDKDYGDPEGLGGFNN